MAGTITGGRVMLEPTGSSEQDITVTGYRYVMPLNAATTNDITWAHDRHLQGASISVCDHSDGDHLDIEMVHPIAGLQHTFGESIYIPVSGEWEVISSGAKLIPAGLILRVRYTSVATTGNQPVLKIYLRTWR